MSSRSRRRTRRPAPPRGPLRLLYVINDLSVGGAQRALLAQAGALDRSRFDVHVASLELLPDGALTGAFRDAGIEVHPLAPPGEPFGLAPFRLRALIRRLAPGLVHTHLAAAGIAGRIAARSCGVPRVVSTLHNVSDWTDRVHHPVRVLDRATLSLADRICAVSDAVRDAAALAAPGLAARTLTLRNGVAIEHFRPRPGARDAARARLGLAPADFVVASVGRLEPYKGIDTLLRAAAHAAARAPMLQLLVVGDGSDRGRLESLAESLDISGSVTFTGTRDDVTELLAAADLFAVPSHTEGLGVAAIEALAAGLPVLASDVGGLPEIVEDGVCGRLLPPHSSAQWAAALATAATAPEALAPWREAATLRALRFTIEASVAELERLYATLCGDIEPPAERTARREAA